MNRMTLTQLRKLKATGEKIACLTAYDASFAHHLDKAGLDILLVGDSLGMVIQGHDSTLPVTVNDMVYHCQQVHRGSQRALLIVDMPFLSYATPDTTLETAARLMREGQAQVVKLEGGAWLVDTVFPSVPIWASRPSLSIESVAIVCKAVLKLRLHACATMRWLYKQLGPHCWFLNVCQAIWPPI